MRRVLIVNRDPEKRLRLRQILEPLAHRVDVASTGWEALSMLYTGSYDLVVSGVKMPIPSGIGVVAMARSAGVRAPVILIEMTPDDESRAIVKGFEDAILLEEPIEADDLLRHAGTLLGKEVRAHA